MTSPASYLRLDVTLPAAFGYSHLRVDGRIRYEISIVNHSSIPAQLPFFCVMDLGFNLEAHQGWQMDKIVSDGRKLLRCSFRGSATLMPAKRLVACSLVLRVSPANGVQVSYGAGAPVALDNFKDLRLFAISGAANFPPERGQLHVPAEEVRSGIRKGLAGHAITSQRMAV